MRGRVYGTKEAPRLSVFRSAKYIYAQMIDDESGKTLLSADDRKIKKGEKTARAFEVGSAISKTAKDKGIKKAVFDRAGYKYHGRVKSLAEGARKEGLKF